MESGTMAAEMDWKSSA